MHARKSRRPAAAGIALAVAFALSGGFSQAQEPKHRPDNPRLVPKQVKYEVKVEPAVARPGDTLKYSVEVTVEEPWHIYAFAKEQPSEGPRSTQFDFFDTDGLEPSGDWKPDQKPVRKKEPAFPNLDAVEYHEDRVTWTRELKVPADAKPGKRTLQNQIYFQICNESACLRPSYVNLPPVEITIQGGGDETTSARPDPPGGPSNERASADREPTRTTQTGAAVTRLSPFGESARRALTAISGSMLVGMQAERAAEGEVENAPAAPKAETAPAAPVNVKGAIEQGFFSFLLFSALGGVAALLMPCVWPMVPITVNFFVKQGHAKGGRSTTGLAIVYCLAIIGIFTLLGVVVSMFFSATSLNQFATNGWLNLFIAAVFLVFGLSLLGLFEIRLPSFLLNASARNEGRGGLVGVIFMATTLVITSFTCTVPVVGGLLVLASKGDYFYPIVGMIVFSTVLALPFFLLALMPGQLSKLPRSGDWMNTVKVVGGLVEIGAALKFVNNAEQGFGAVAENAWVDAQVMLAAWVVLAAICGVYLLGFFRTDHDHGDVRVGPIRMLSGAAFLFLALYLAPALFGYPPKGRVYDRMVVGILPPDVGELSQPREILTAIPGLLPAGAPALMVSDGNAAPAEQAVPAKATSSDPQVAIRQEKSLHGVVWGMSLEEAKEKARENRRPIIIDFTGVYCVNCRTMEQSVFPKPEIVELLKQFERVQLYVDDVQIETLTQEQRGALAEQNAEFQLDLVDQTSQPYYVVIDPDGKVLAESAFAEVPQFRKFLENGLQKFRGAGEKVAQTAGAGVEG